jgi:hypothetical protein
MIWHRFSPHINRPVLHLKMFTDIQVLIVLGLGLFALMYVWGGFGALPVRLLVAFLVLTPAGVMALDNRSGQTLRLWWFARTQWRSTPGVYEPIVTGEITGYTLDPDPDELAREASAANAMVDVATLFDPQPQSASA